MSIIPNKSLSKEDRSFSAYRSGLFTSGNDAKSLQQTWYSNGSFVSKSDEHEKDLFEQDCIYKLRTQRQKIEELTCLYRAAQQDMKKSDQKISQFQIQLADYEEMKSYKHKYLSLLKQFEALMVQKQSFEQKSVILKQKIAEMVKQNQEIMKLTTLQKSKHKSEVFQYATNFTQLLKDKQDQMTRHKNIYQTKEQQYLDQIYRLNEGIKEMKREIDEFKRKSSEDIEKKQKQLHKKDQTFTKLSICLDNMKQQNKILRLQVKQLQGQFVSKEQEWIDIEEGMVQQINQLKRNIGDIEHVWNQAKYKQHKAEQQIVLIKQQNSELKSHIKKFEQHSQQIISKIQSDHSLATTQLKQQLMGLKQSLQQLLQVKDVLLKENTFLKDRIQKQQQSKKRRKLLMMSEFRQIQKLQNALNRI